jgi:hypothetical protein
MCRYLLFRFTFNWTSVGRIGVQRVGAKRGPMTGSGAIHVYGVSQGELRHWLTKSTTKVSIFVIGLADIFRMLLEKNAL